MNIKELLDTIESQKEHLEYKDEIYADLAESLRLANEANKDMTAKLKDAIVTPCKVGDSVYWFNMIGEIKKAQVIETSFVARLKDGFEYDVRYSDIGKTVFLSRDEAEKALAERGKE